MHAALSRTSCRRALSERLTPALSPLTLGRIQIQPSICLAVYLASNATRHAATNSRWKLRQGRDHFARQAKVQGLKSRAAFKLLEMDAKYHLFKRGQTVVDLGYAPGSWSQVAVERTKPNGSIIGIDLIPAQPPKGVTTIQGNFLSPQIQALAKSFLLEQKRHRDRERKARRQEAAAADKSLTEDLGDGETSNIVTDRLSYIDLEKQASLDIEAVEGGNSGRLVDIVLSDMSEPWPQTSGFSSNTLSNPYIRLMNTSGINFKDHANSMDLCLAALEFASDTLKAGGHFVCKFYQGAEDKFLKKRLEKMFTKVHQEKPESSRNDSKEMYFVALKRKGDVLFNLSSSDPI